MSNESKYNIIMPETTECVLCVQVEKVISVEGYKENFLPKLQAMIDNCGEIRILIFYKNYQGWEFEAAIKDMEASALFGKYLKKLALVNAPDKEVFQRQLKKELLGGDIGFFAKTEFDKALKWVKE